MLNAIQHTFEIQAFIYALVGAASLLVIPTVGIVKAAQGKKF